MKSTPTDKTSEKTAVILIETGSVIFRPKQPFKFDSGIVSPIYVDNRLLISSVKSREAILKNLLSLVEKIGKPDVVAGVATAGIPHAAWLAHKLKIPMVYVRSKPKDHGRENQVEGSVKRGQLVLVVEDMVSTAGSSINVIKSLRNLGAKVTDEIAIYTHGMKEANNNFKKNKIKFHPLTNITTVAEIARKKGFLKKENISIILDWAKDPKNWGKKMGFS
jgi:orotate phosphoribosyltransferase